MTPTISNSNRSFKIKITKTELSTLSGYLQVKLKIPIDTKKTYKEQQ